MESTSVVVPISREILIEAVNKDRDRRVDEGLGAMKEEQQALARDINSTLQDLRGDCGDTVTEIKDRLEKLDDRAQRAIRWSVIPAAVLMIVVGVVTIWTTVGGTILQLEKRSDDLMAAVKKKESELAELTGQMAVLQKQLSEVQGKAGFPAEVKNRIDGIQVRVKTLEDAGLAKRIKALEDASKASSNTKVP